MVKMTISARRMGGWQSLNRIGRLAFFVLISLLFSAGSLGWFVPDDVLAAANEAAVVATPLPPLPAQPAAAPTPKIQTVSQPPAAVESLVWPWKQVNPEPKARLAEVRMNTAAADSAATDSADLDLHAVSAANNVTSIGQIGGASFRVAVSGNYAYIGSGYDMTVLDVSNPAALFLTGKTTSSWADEVLGISVQGNYAYVATGNEGLRIVDVSNGTLPVEVGFYNTPGYAWDVAVYGNYVFIADGENGLQIVDATTAYAPQLKANLRLGGIAMDVVIVGMYAYVAGESEGLYIVDITDPANPVETGHLKTQGRAVGLTVANDYAFLAADTSGLRIVDASSKSEPVEIASFDTRGNAYAVDVDAMTNTAFVADSGEGLRAVDISDKTAPREMGHFDVAGCWANDIKVHGSYAYLIDTSHGLRVLNVTNPTELSQVYLYNSPATTDVKIMNDTAFVTAGSAGLRVVDVSDGTSPSESGYFDTPGYAYAVDLAFPPDSASTYACVADWEKGLRIVNVTNPRAPYEVGAVDTPGMARGVAVLWPYAYVADDTMGLQIVALSDVSDPAIVGTCNQTGCMPPGGSARGVTMYMPSGSSQKLAFVADGDKGVRLIDVTDPLNPAEIGFYDTPGEAQNIAISPTHAYAYVADGFSGGLQIVDFSSLSNLVSLGAVDTEGGASDLNASRSLETSGDIVFLADGAQGLRVFTVEPLVGGRPVVSEKGFYDTRGWAGRLTVIGNTSYIADGEDGLRILEVSAAWVPSIVAGNVTSAEGEPIAGVSIATNLGAAVQTDTAGKFTFTDLPAAEAVTLTPALYGYTFSPASLELTTQENKARINFSGTRVIKESVSGLIADAKGKPLAGVTVKIVSGQEGVRADAMRPVTTDDKGQYSLLGLKPGKFTIAPSLKDFTFSPPSLTFTMPLPAGQVSLTTIVGQKEEKPAEDGVKAGVETQAETLEIENRVTGADKEIFPLGGRIVDEKGLGIAGVAVSDGAGHEVTSDENGIFLMALPGGAYRLTPAKNGLVFEPPSRQVVVSQALQSQDFSASQSEYTISGTIRRQGKPLAGVSISDGNGKSVTTDSDGVFRWNARAGNFVLTPVKEGYSFVPEVLRVAFPDVQNAAIEIDAQETSFIYNGTVRVQGGSPLAGVNISDETGQISSDRMGEFVLERPQGTYSFMAVKDGYTIRPDSFSLVFPDPSGGKNIELLASALCPNYILNGDFERDGDWVPPSGSAVEYSQDIAYRGERSVVVGPTRGSKPLNGHINLRQRITIPKNAKSADLRFVLYPFSELAIDASGDTQQVLILDRNQKDKERILNLRSEERVWKPYRFDLRKYAGQTIWITFDVINDGKGGSLGMNIDDVTLQVCE